jgi:hypothetical protein
MKNAIIFLFLTFLAVCTVSAKQPTTKQLRSDIAKKDSIILDLQDSLTAIPDTLCVTALDSTFCVPTKDAQEVVIPIVDYIKETSTNGWPKTGKGWLLWLLGLIPLVFGAKKLTAINNVWAVLKPYLKTRLGLAVLSGGALALLVTFVVSSLTKSDFNFTMLMVIWPWGSLGASFLHNIKAKKKDAAVQAS